MGENNDNKFSNYEILLKSIPVFTGILIFGGILKGAVFYFVFGISILEYISLSEAILMALEDIVALIIVVAIAVAFIFGTSPGQRKENNDRLFFGFVWTIISLSYAIYLFITIYVNNRTDWSNFASMTLLALALYEIYHRRKMRTLPWLISPKIKKGIVAGLCLIFFICGISLVQAFELKLGKPEFTVLIKGKDSCETVQTSDSLIYVGRKDKYVFLYNKRKRQEGPEIISTSEITNIQFKRSR
ncbi:MAG TPA: hypothetical protein VNS58_09145 [Puia sp.]|nr:hypothetical protein [Puia sp.]